MRFNSSLLAALVCALTSAAELSAAEPAGRPNILFCFADDWGRYASAFAKCEDGPSPNQVVRTPNVDRVAQNGVLFRRAFVNAPSCTPCRSSLLSGRYFFRTGRGAILNGAVWDSTIPSYPLLLKDAGYHIGKSSKVWSPGTPADAPYGGQTYSFQKAGMLFNKFSTNVTKAISDGTPLEKAKEAMLAEVRKNFEDFLAARKEGQPFCYWFGPTNTHRAWIKGSGKALWGIDPESLKGKLPKNLPDVPEVRQDFADYLGEAQAYDAYIGVLVKKLEETKQLDNTMIVLSGDHGAPGFPGGKCNLYDFGVGVTLVASLPGQKSGRVVDDLVSLIDLAPTFLDVAGVKHPDGINGRSLLPILKSDKSGQVDPMRTCRSSPAASATSPPRARTISRIPCAPCAPTTFSTSATSSPSARRWATATTSRRTKPPAAAESWRTTRRSPSPTWTPARPRPGWSPTATTPNGNGTSTTPLANAPAKNSTTCAKTPTRSRTSPMTRTMPPRRRKWPNG